MCKLCRWLTPTELRDGKTREKRGQSVPKQDVFSPKSVQMRDSSSRIPSELGAVHCLPSSEGGLYKDYLGFANESA